MSNHPRPLLLGYIRADVLKDRADLPGVEAQLEAFADREASAWVRSTSSAARPREHSTR